MLTILDTKGRYCPVITCDFCGKVIEKAEDGNAEWNLDDVGARVPGKVFFTHKACSIAFERSHGGEITPEGLLAWGNEELAVFLFNLIDNLKVDLKRAKRSSDLFQD